MLHTLHRAVIPILQQHDLANNLFRTAHVMVVSSYWLSLLRRAHNVVQRNMTVSHHVRQSTPEHKRVADNVLFLTLLNCEAVANASEKTRALVEEIQLHFPGDWTSRTIVYACYREDCPGGNDCRQAAVKHVMSLLYKMLFGKRIVLPTTSRW